MYENLRSCVLVGKGHSDEFEVKVSIHQGPVLNPLLFTGNGKDLADWKQGFITCLYKEKGDA